MSFAYLKNHKLEFLVAFLLFINLFLGGAVLLANIAQHDVVRPTKTNPSITSSVPTAKSTQTLGTQTSAPSSSNPTQSSPKPSYPAFKPYIPSNCTTTVIPYQTVYENVSYLNVGQTSSWGGINGSIKTCSADSNGFKPADFNLQPFDKTVYVGIGSSSTTPSSPQYTYNEAIGLAQNNCAQYSNSSAYQQCVSAYLHKFGY